MGAGETLALTSLTYHMAGAYICEASVPSIPGLKRDKTVRVIVEGTVASGEEIQRERASLVHAAEFTVFSGLDWEPFEPRGSRGHNPDVLSRNRRPRIGAPPVSEPLSQSGPGGEADVLCLGPPGTGDQVERARNSEYIAKRFAREVQVVDRSKPRRAGMERSKPANSWISALLVS